tara:strand:+ start:1022 stop:1249 length:228 start_codon:yes stop_codon:yes gene_type:complete
MTYIYQVIREWSQDNGTQYNVLGTYSTMSDAEDAADEAERHGGSNEDRGYIGIMMHELNPERVSVMNDTGYPAER